VITTIHQDSKALFLKQGLNEDVEGCAGARLLHDGNEVADDLVGREGLSVVSPGRRRVEVGFVVVVDESVDLCHMLGVLRVKHQELRGEVGVATDIRRQGRFDRKRDERKSHCWLLKLPIF